MGRITLWAKTDNHAAQVFAPIMCELYDFVTWGMTEGDKHIKYRWGAKDAWVDAVPSFRRTKRVEAAQSRAATENEKLLFLADSRGSNGTGRNAGRTVYPDSHLWVRECANYLTATYGHSMVAYFLDIIDLFDLAKLCYSGDVLKARHEVAMARAKLKEWCFG